MQNPLPLPECSNTPQKRRRDGPRFLHLCEQHWIGSPASQGKLPCTPTGENSVPRRLSEGSMTADRKATLLENLIKLGAIDATQADLLSISENKNKRNSLAIQIQHNTFDSR